VIFRFDDVQDYWLNKVQMEVINTFKEKNIPLTIGVIGNHTGEDPELISFLKTALKNNGSTLEIANHGWNHEYFPEFDKNNQSILMKKANDKIHNLFGIRPDVFLPPMNGMDNNTISAAEENNIHYMSPHSSNPFLLNTSSSIVKLYPFSYSTAIQLPDGSWVNESVEDIFNNIIKDIENQGYSIITLHPQEYAIRNGVNYSPSIDVNQTKELEILLDKVNNAGLRNITLSELNVEEYFFW
jgi:peptidoglycan/xylan/chitin deacetylase (PgdA/CDA1 family)